MRKLIALIMVLSMAMAITACGAPAASSSSGDGSTSMPAGSASTSMPAGSASTSMPAGSASTSAPSSSSSAGASTPAATVTTVGTLPTVEAPVMVTSVGQSADASMLNAMMGNTAINFTFDQGITGEELGDTKTLIVAAGASTKGMTSAGVTVEEEEARTTALLEAAVAADMTVIMVHVGGSARRGAMSDEFTMQVMEVSDYLLVLEGSNNDNYFTDYVTGKDLPITYALGLKDAITALETLFA